MNKLPITDENSFYQNCMNYLKNLEVAYVDRFMPFFFCSAAVHEFNKYNSDYEIWLSHGKIVNTRLHVLFVSPPGFMKTFASEILMYGPKTIFGDSVIPCDYQGSMTEASFTGTVRMMGDELVKQYGIAKTKSDHILAIEEFSALTEMMKQSHSTLLDTALLTALDSGRLSKGLGLGSFNYKTNLTLWVSTQPARFDLTGGMGRRFLTLLFLPTIQDQQTIKAAMRRGENVPPNIEHLNLIKRQMSGFVENINKIDSIHFDKSILDLFDEQNVIFYIELLYKRLALGYHLVEKWNGEPNIVVKADPTLKKLILQLDSWRSSIMQGSEEAQVINIIRTQPGIGLSELKQKLSAYGYTYAKSSVLIEQLVRQKEIQMKKIETSGRPRLQLYVTTY